MLLSCRYSRKMIDSPVADILGWLSSVEILGHMLLLGEDALELVKRSHFPPKSDHQP